MTDTEKLKFLESAIEKLFNQTLQLAPGDELRDLGLDSLDVIELQLNYEETVGKIIPDTAGPFNTVRDLIDLM
jgi:acyl carrier protein